eukprot:6628384-Karenia_brevis.AAC.1
MDIMVVDLNEHNVIPLRRNVPFPAAQWPTSYVFDPMSRDEEDELVLQARELARILGFESADPRRAVDAPGLWRVADTASTMFGTAVPEDALGDPDA